MSSNTASLKPGFQIDLFYQNISVFNSFSIGHAFPTNLIGLLDDTQTSLLPDEAPPIDKINPFSKMAVTFEPLMRF